MRPEPAVVKENGLAPPARNRLVLMAPAPFLALAVCPLPLAFLAIRSVSHKHYKIELVLAAFRGQDLDPHYLGYFDLFNRQLFFEAHEVLEPLWLAERGGPEDHFYKGLIQLAGAFVHVQKRRPGPAEALLRLALANLGRYPHMHHRLDVAGLMRLIEGKLAEGFRLCGSDRPFPLLKLDC